MLLFSFCSCSCSPSLGEGLRDRANEEKDKTLDRDEKRRTNECLFSIVHQPVCPLLRTSSLALRRDTNQRGVRKMERTLATSKCEKSQRALFTS
jgi:hypothetical protein